MVKHRDFDTGRQVQAFPPWIRIYFNKEILLPNTWITNSRQHTFNAPLASTENNVYKALVDLLIHEILIYPVFLRSKRVLLWHRARTKEEMEFLLPPSKIVTALPCWSGRHHEAGSKIKLIGTNLLITPTPLTFL